MSAGAVATTAGTVSKRQPTGLYVLFFTEMWERFSYYGMRALLMYYMTKALLIQQSEASSIYGLYTGFVYLTPIMGGYLADRYLGQRKTVYLGGIIMAIGQFMMMSQALFFPALVVLVIGVGTFKPNVTAQVGSLYGKGDHRRDRAFSLYYVGINIGALLAGLVCGTLGELYGWNYGFGAAGVGVLLGLVIYRLGQKHLAPDNIMKKKASKGNTNNNEPLTRDDWMKVMALVVLCILNIVFWAAYEQQGNTMALWADTYTNRFIFGWEMPATWFQSFNPIMIFAFTPLVMAFWAWQDKRKKEPSSVSKMAIGCFLLGGSYLIMVYAAKSIDAGGKASLWMLAANTAILTLGELYLSPVGLSLVTKIAPAKIVSMMMGVWFLSSFAGNYLCGYLGTFWDKMPKDQFFLLLTALPIASGFLFLALLKPLKKAIGHGKAVDM